MKEKVNLQGSGISVNIHIPVGKINAVVQFIHGMTEHSGRYDDFAEYLNLNGIAFASYDLRGHGVNKKGECASFGKDGWEKSIDEIKSVRDYLSDRFSGVPQFVIGFSLGSFLVREYLANYPGGIDGAILMGTGTQPVVVLGMIMPVVKGQIRKGGYDKATDLVKNLSMQTYNRKFKNPRTPFDWLCSDETELEKYINDPLCTDCISSGLFYDLLSSMKKTADKDIYDRYDKNLPVLIISGKGDAVGNFGGSAGIIRNNMEKSGMKKVSVVLLDSCRHDILHEKSSGAACRAEEFIKEFICGNIGR